MCDSAWGNVLRLAAPLSVPDIILPENHLSVLPMEEQWCSRAL